MAMPRLPGLSGSCSSIALPAAVFCDGLECTVAPQASIIDFRNGFCWKDAATCQTSHSRPNMALA